MVRDVSALRLTPALRLRDFQAVRTTDAIRLCRGGAFEALAPRKAVSRVADMDTRELGELRSFLWYARLAPVPLPSVNDWELVRLLCKAITNGTVTAVRASEAGAADASDATVARRKLVRAIAAKIRGQLRFGGRAC
jgi:hypothetical protein